MRDFAPLFTAQSRAEVGVTALLPDYGNLRVSGQIDRLAVTDDAVLIVDFKTNRPPPATVEETSTDLYRADGALSRGAGADLSRQANRLRLDLDRGTKLMKLPSALLDAELTRIGRQ